MSKKLNNYKYSSDVATTSLKRKESDSKLSQRAPKSQKIGQNNAQVNATYHEDEPRFTFEEVKEMIDRLLNNHSRTSAAVSASFRKVNFDEIVVGDHSIEGCRELIKQMVHATRRVRTLQEVLCDIKDNLNKRVYTEIIHRATLKEEAPKKPPSAYLLYHADRYDDLRRENPLAVEVSKIVAEEWRDLPEKKRREYQKKHDELVKKYESEMERLGLIDDNAPKRPKPAKTMYVDAALANYSTETWSKETLAAERERIGQSYDNLPPQEKQEWIDLHQRSLKEYLKQREEYAANHPHLNHALPDKKTRANEKAKLPVPPKSAKKFFMLKKIPEGLTAQEVDEAKRKFKEKFKHLREKKLLKYVKKAVQDKERYDKEIEQYKKQNPGKPIPRIKPNITKDQYKLYAKVIENRPAVPALTAYLHYCGRMLTDMNDNDDEQAPTRRMQTASQSWQHSTDKEKRVAIKEHITDIERYIREMESWLADQTEERKAQVLAEDVKVNPEYWRKKLNKIKKSEAKKKEQRQAAAAAALMSPNKHLSPIKSSPSSKSSPSKIANNHYQNAQQNRNQSTYYSPVPQATYFTAYDYRN